MFIKSSNLWIISKNSNTDYWGQDVSPEWTTIGTFMYHPGAERGTGAEPHYHDADEIWIFDSGRGEAGIDGERYDVTPNTVVYTPMGSVHRFQMFTRYANASVVTMLEDRKRPDHLYSEVDGAPVPTGPGFVVPGAENNGPLADRGTRCPFTEIRTVSFLAGEQLEEEELSANEHWLAETGVVVLVVDGLRVELSSGDVAMIRAGARRRLSCPDGATAALVRE